MHSFKINTHTGSTCSIIFTGRVCNHKTPDLKHFNIKVNALFKCFLPSTYIYNSLFSIIIVIIILVLPDHPVSYPELLLGAYSFILEMHE